MTSALRPAGPLVYRANRAAAYDPPEDFILRLESELDEETRDRLAGGLRILRSQRRMKRWVARFLVVGAAVLVGGIAVAVVGRFPNLELWIILLTAPALILAGLVFVASLVVSLRYRSDLRKVYAFWRAMQGSSLARDLV